MESSIAIKLVVPFMGKHDFKTDYRDKKFAAFHNVSNEGLQLLSASMKQSSNV